MMAWKISIVLIAGSPIIGYGPECMNLAVKTYLNYDKYPQHNFINILNRAHSVYMHTMVSSGIIAGVSHILIVLKAIYNGLNKEKLNYLTALTCSVTAYFVQSNFSSNVISVAPIFWVFMAIIIKEYFFIYYKGIIIGGLNNKGKGTSKSWQRLVYTKDLELIV